LVKLTIAVGSLLISISFCFSAHAQLYWDHNEDNGAGGAGGATPAGVWDVNNSPYWNVNSGGVGIPGVWTDGSDAVFAAGNDATGAYTVTLGGTVSANSISFEEGSVTISGGTELDLNGAGTVDVASGATGILGSVVGGFATLNKTGTGTLDLTNANTFTGGYTLTGGTTRVNNNTALGTASTTVSIGDGTTLAATGGTARTLTYGFTDTGNFTLGQAAGGTGALTLAGTFDLTGGVRTITVNNPSDTISAVVSGGGIIKEGTGTLTLSGTNTYTGATTVNAGILSVTNASGLGTTGGNTTVNSGATLQVSGGITINEKISLTGNGSTGSNGAIRKTGNNTTTIFGTLTGDGLIAVTQGTLRLTQTSAGGDNANFTGPITVTGTSSANSTLRFEFISPSQLGPTGVITLDFGTLRNDNSAAPGNGSMLPSGRTITLGAGGGTLDYNTSGGLSIVNPTSVISGTGGLSKTGVGIVSIAAACTYGGPTHVIGGTLRVRSNNERYPNGSALTIDSGATFDVDGLTETMGSLAGAGTLEINGGSFLAGGDNTSTAFTGLITGSGTGTNLTKQGTGTLTINGTNTYTGVTAISAGVIRVQTSAALGTTAGATTVSSGAALEIDGTSLAIDDPMTISGTGITSTGAIRNLANDNSMAGSIALSGNARIQSDAGTLTTSGTIKSSNTTTRNLTVGGAGNLVMSGVIGDPAATNNVGTLTKSDAGVLTLSSATGNVYTGATAVNGGTLLISNTSGSATGTAGVTVAGGATLGGNGTIAGAITNNGTIAPGTSIGTLNAGSGVSMGDNSHVAIELATGGSSDLLAITGDLNLNSTNNLDYLDLTGGGTGPWTVITYTGTRTGTFDFVTGLPSGYAVSYATSGQVNIVPSAGGLPGDFNSDGKVDAADYVRWRKANGTNNALPNDNGLGVPIGPNHFALWKQNFGRPPGSGTGGGLGGGTSVPEPAGIAIVGIGLALLGFGRCRSK
jgi:fibronectin-binding autotransporter adhesin